MLKPLQNWLAASDSVAEADLIFVLAGRQSRKVFGVQLFGEGRAPQILFSVARFELRRFARLNCPAPCDLPAIAASVPPRRRHFFVWLEHGMCRVQRIPIQRFGTFGEIQALADWLAGHAEVGSVLLVTSGLHIRRVRLCCRALLPRNLCCRVVAVPGKLVQSHDSEETGCEPGKAVITELFKLFVYRILMLFRARRGDT